MSVTAKFKLNLKDVRALDIDIDEDVYFTVTGENLRDINNEAEEAVRDFVASANQDAEDRIDLKRFIK